MSGGLGHIPAETTKSPAPERQQIWPAKSAEQSSLRLFDDPTYTAFIDPFSDDAQPVPAGPPTHLNKEVEGAQEDWKGLFRKYPGATAACEHFQQPECDWLVYGRKNRVDRLWLLEIMRRLALVPEHSKAYGLKLFSEEQQEAVFASVSRWFDYNLDGDADSAGRAIVPYARVLHLLWHAKDLLRLPVGVFSFLSTDADQLKKIATSEAGQTRSIHNLYAKRETLVTGIELSNETWKLQVRADIAPLNETNIVESLKAYAPERRLKILKQKNREFSLWVSQALELVGDHKGKMSRKYVSATELRTFAENQAAQEKWASEHRLVDRNSGKSVSMLTVTSTKKKAQMSQFYAIAQGIQGIATARSWDYCMITLTLPGEWHSARTGKAAGRESEWNAATPLEGVRELQQRWNRVATRIKQIVGRDALGFSIKEPHADGTGHMHCFLAGPKRALVAVREYLIEYASREGGPLVQDGEALVRAGEDVSMVPRNVFENTRAEDERYRTTIVDFLAWKPKETYSNLGKRASSPASYMFKYLNKGLLNAEVSAWKSCVNVRQISWINFGRGFVSRWQACYAQRREHLTSIDPDFIGPPAFNLAVGQKDIADIVQAMVVRDWTSAVAALLQLRVVHPDFIGPVERDQRLFKAVDSRTTRFHEQVRACVGYTTYEDSEYLTNRSAHEWVLERVDAPSGQGGEAALG